MANLIERLLDTGCDREPFTPDHAKCKCRLASEAAREIERLMSQKGVRLPLDVWRSVDAALSDYLRFGPGELDSEYVPDEHLERALRAIRKIVGG